MTSEHSDEIDPMITELGLISCQDMPRLIVLRSIHRVPRALQAKVEAHLEQCTKCHMKSIALDTAYQLDTERPQP